MSNAQFVNCIINQSDFSWATGTTLINSVVWHPTYIGQYFIMYNSIMNCYSSSLYDFSAYNSIFIRRSYSGPDSSCVFFNCIGINASSGSGSPYGNAYASGCATYASLEDIFETFDGTFALDETFVLKEEVATGFLGSDGTQVGIYGGMLPYNPRPSYMVLKRCNVAGRSTIDGKLSVDIEVVTEE